MPTLLEELADLRNLSAYLNADGMRRVALLSVIEFYDRSARANRPDWSAFLTEANAEPAFIAEEVLECVHDVGDAASYAIDADGDVSDRFVNEMYALAQRWLREVTDAHDRGTVTVTAHQRVQWSPPDGPAQPPEVQS